MMGKRPKTSGSVNSSNGTTFFRGARRARSLPIIGPCATYMPKRPTADDDVSILGGKRRSAQARSRMNSLQCAAPS